MDTPLSEMCSGMLFMATQELELLGNSEPKNLKLSEWENEILQIALPFKQCSICDFPSLSL